MEHLPVGDYCLDRGIVVERNTHADFAISLVDGRLFPQAAKLAHCPHRPIILIEGPRPARMPDVHPHALKGAIVSLAVRCAVRGAIRPGAREAPCRSECATPQPRGWPAWRWSTVRPEYQRRLASDLMIRPPARCRLVSPRAPRRGA
jgi:hypothetical protein